MHILAAGIAAAAVAGGDNLLVNGSFEEPDVPPGSFEGFRDIPGWTHLDGPGYEIWDSLFGWDSAQGDQHLESNLTVFEQAVATEPGRQYELSFAWSPRPGVPDNHVVIEWDGEVVAQAQATGTGVAELEWSVTSVVVEADGEQGTLRVVGDNDDPLVGMQIDDFRVELHCAADLDGNGVLNILDFVAFQSAWVDQEPAGDCDGNGLFNILDFVCFQGLFVAGC